MEQIEDEKQYVTLNPTVLIIVLNVNGWTTQSKDSVFQTKYITKTHP